MIRKARVKDIGQIQALINQFARQELMLPRSLFNLYECLRDFWVYQSGKVGGSGQNNRIVGCCALHIIWEDLPRPFCCKETLSSKKGRGLAEIRSLAVKKPWQRKGIGNQLVGAAICEAKEIGCKSVFVLTYIPDYFKRYGFRRVSKERLPHKIWADCINCPKFPDCKEVALIKKL
jgi:amino-acid N-acetyltransferase